MPIKDRKLAARKPPRPPAPLEVRGTPDERKKFAWKLLKQWKPRSRVVEALMTEFGISQGVAYQHISDLYEELSEQRRMSRRAEAEALIEQIDEQIESVKAAEEPETVKAKALVPMWDMRAKLAPAYRDPQRIAILVAQAKELTGLSDGALDALIESETKQLTAGAVDVEGEES
jgi:hypothetical protein